MQPDPSQSSVLAAFKNLGPIQIVVLAIVALIAIAGAVVSFVSPTSLSFKTYTDSVIPQLVAGLGILGIGKGLHLGLAGRTEQKALTDLPDILKALEHGQVAAALAIAAADLDVPATEEPLATDEALPSDEEEAAAPPPPVADLPPQPDEPPSNEPNLPAGTGLAASAPGGGPAAVEAPAPAPVEAPAATAPEPEPATQVQAPPPVSDLPPPPSAEEVQGARNILARASQVPTSADIAAARAVLARAPQA